MDSLVNLSIGIISGIIGGIISSIIIYYYSEQRIKARKIIEYAERTAEKAYLILEEANKYSEGNDIKLLKQLIKKEVRRNFPGRIVNRSKLSEQLQKSIAKCNSGINNIEKAIEVENPKSTLIYAISDLNNSLLDIWNAITEYDVAEDKRIEKHKKLFMLVTFLVIVIVFIIILA